MVLDSDMVVVVSFIISVLILGNGNCIVCLYSM